MLADMGSLLASKSSRQGLREKKHFLLLLLCLCLSLHPTLTFNSLESKIKDKHSGKQLSWRFTQAQDIIPITRSQTPSQWLPIWCRLPKNIKIKMNRAHGCFSSGGISWCFSTCLVTDTKTERGLHEPGVQEPAGEVRKEPVSDKHRRRRQLTFLSTSFHSNTTWSSSVLKIWPQS